MNICKKCKNYDGECIQIKNSNWYKKIDQNIYYSKPGIHLCKTSSTYIDYINGIEKLKSRLCSANNTDGNCPNFKE